MADDGRRSVLITGAVVLVFAAVVGVTALRVAGAYHVPGGAKLGEVGLIDFHRGVYFPVVAFDAGVNPYGSEYVARYPVRRPMTLYSPALFWLFRPFASLPLEAAGVVYFVVSVCLTVALAAAALRVCKLPVDVARVLALATLLLASRAGHVNIFLGQLTLPIVLGVIATLELGRRRPALAGAGLVLATLKPTFGIPLIWLTLCRGHWKAAAIGVAASGFLAAAGCVSFIAGDGLDAFIRSVGDAASFLESGPETRPTLTWTRIDAMVILARVLGTDPSALATVVTATILLLCGGWFVRRSAQRERSDPSRQTGAASRSAVIVCLTILTSVYHNMYDGLLLLVPWIAVTFGVLGNEVSRAPRRMLTVLLALPAINYLSARTAIELLGIDGALWQIATTSNSVAILVALMTMVWLERKDSMAAPSSGQVCPNLSKQRRAGCSDSLVDHR